MSNIIEIENININNIELDRENPRLPEMFRKQDISEKDIINWMLADASIIELMLAIGQNGFFVGEAILVVKNKNKKYTVIEGNRRVTSVMLLNNPSLAEIHTKKITKVLEETRERPTEIPCIVFDDKKEIMQYLGYRHITGIKSWGMLAKGRYLNSLISTLESTTLSQQARELAKKIGSRSDYVKRVLVSFKIYELIVDSGFYQIKNLNETTFHFNYIADSLRHENIKNFIGINLDDDNTLSNIDKNKLSTLIKLFFIKNEQNRSRVLGNSDNLTKLNKIFANNEVTIKFVDGFLSLDEAFNLVEVDAGTFTAELYKSLQNLKTSNSYIHQITNHNNNDIDLLSEIIDLCEVIENTILMKKSRKKRKEKYVD